MNAQLDEILASMGCKVWREITRDSGESSLVVECQWTDTSAEYFNLGWFETLEEAELTALYNLETFGMNLFKQTKIFPNIRPQMLVDNPVTLYMSGKVSITATRDGDERVEIFFEGSEKSAVINRTQTLRIIEMYGPETDNWKGMPITLYAEEGKWFGRWQWGLRVVNYNSKNPDENGKTLGVTAPRIDAPAKKRTDKEAEKQPALIDDEPAPEYS